jgi:hypothetical protein
MNIYVFHLHKDKIMPQRKFNKEAFIVAVQSSNSIREVLGKLGVAQEGGNYKVFHRAAKTFNVDISHLSCKNSYGKEKKKRDIITNEELISAINNSISYQSILKLFNLRPDINSNNNWIRNKIASLNIDVSHFLGQGHLKGKKHNWGAKIALADILVKNSDYSSTSGLGKRLIKEEILPNQCNRCSINTWQGEELSLHLDHIDGDNTNHEISNLRLLCPNCHSLTPTYCGRNKGKK